jgi:ornithine cyclodeaminase
VAEAGAPRPAPTDAVPFYGREALSAVLDFETLIEWMDAAHRLERPETVDSLIGPDAGRLLLRSAVLPGRAMGAKVVTLCPGNAARGLPSVQAVFVLFDGSNGSPLAMLDGTALTYWKTAADSALGSRYLARRDCRILLIVGAGGMAPWLARAHLCACPGIAEVLIWNRTASRAADLAASLTEEGIPALPIADLAAAASRADIISTATMTRAPLIRGDWLKAGTHLDLVGSYMPLMREADDAAIRRARLFTDFRPSACEVGEFALPIASGAMTEQDLIGDLYDLASGQAGRLSSTDITLFKNAGGAHLDLMTAQFLLERL